MSKSYLLAGGTEYWALRDIDLEVREQEFVAIMGPSGHGKTTLMNIIGLLDKPTTGNVIVDGVDTSRLGDVELSRLRNEKLGFVFQQYNLINRMSVLENIEIALMLRGIPRDERVKMVGKALEMIGGEKMWLRKKPNQLSGGQQQRVAIARAIIGDPEIILADEPTGNLDTASSKVIIQTFVELNAAGKTIIMVTHNPEVAAYAKRRLFIRDGRIIGEELHDGRTSESLFVSIPHPQPTAGANTSLNEAAAEARSTHKA
ncbi:MAG: ABC transporter ATP-binding protein [Candidatus Bathyarchaeia archaeon]